MDKMEMLNRQNTILAGRVAELKKNFRILEDIADERYDENTRLKQLIERMKCCANCKHQDYSEVEYCYKCSREYAGADTKDNWEMKE